MLLSFLSYAVMGAVTALAAQWSAKRFAVKKSDIRKALRMALLGATFGFQWRIFSWFIDQIIPSHNLLRTLAYAAAGLLLLAQTTILGDGYDTAQKSIQRSFRKS